MATPLRRRARARGDRHSRRGPRATPLLVGLLAAALVFGTATASPTATPGETTTFEVYAHGEDEVAFSRQLVVGDRFRLEHTHSVTKREVVETFSVPDPATIALEELWFDEPGPNLPAGSEPIGESRTTFLQEDGAFRVLHHGHPIGTLPLMVGGPDVDHRLVFDDGQQVSLLDTVRRGERVEIRVGGGNP